MENGLRYVYTGNVIDPEGAATVCHACGAQLIGRLGYTITDWHLTDDGHCARCGTPCAGVFEGPAGDWGARRRPVRLSDYGRPPSAAGTRAPHRAGDPEAR